MVFTGVRQLSPYMLMMPLMMIMGTVGFMAGGGPGGKKIPEIDEDRKEYLRYLGNIRSRVTDSATAQVAFFAYHAPHPDDLLSTGRLHPAMVASGQLRVLCGHPGRHRIGTSGRPVAQAGDRGELSGPEAAPQAHLEPVSHMWLTKFLRTHGIDPRLSEAGSAQNISHHCDRWRSDRSRSPDAGHHLPSRGFPAAGSASDPSAHRRSGEPGLWSS